MTSIFERLLTANLFTMIIVFARLGTILSLLPGFGDSFVSTRIRLVFALAVTVVMAPILADKLPPVPNSLGGLALLLLGEIGVGIFIGLVGRVFYGLLETAGTLVSLQIGLSSASILNPLLADQGSVVGVFMLLLGSVIILETDLHHLMLRASIDSYGLFVPGHLPPIGDFTHEMTDLVAQSFRIAIEISGPFLVVSTLLYLSFGLMGRLVPQLQVFFVGLPAQILVGLASLAFSLSVIYLVFSNGLASTFGAFLTPK